MVVTDAQKQDRKLLYIILILIISRFTVLPVLESFIFHSPLVLDPISFAQQFTVEGKTQIKLPQNPSLILGWSSFNASTIPPHNTLSNGATVKNTESEYRDILTDDFWNVFYIRSEDHQTNQEKVFGPYATIVPVSLMNLFNP